jgi:hypothetical protein
MRLENDSVSGMKLLLYSTLHYHIVYITTTSGPGHQYRLAFLDVFTRGKTGNQVFVYASFLIKA